LHHKFDDDDDDDHHQLATSQVFWALEFASICDANSITIIIIIIFIYLLPKCFGL
jgi:hypothetical protein